MKHPVTPDGRYFVVKGQLWRCSNPQLQESRRKQLVHELMRARRAVKTALNNSDPERLKLARSEVDESKTALGERGPVWWTDGAPDYNRHKVTKTPYHRWHKKLEESSNGTDDPCAADSFDQSD